MRDLRLVVSRVAARKYAVEAPIDEEEAMHGKPVAMGPAPESETEKPKCEECKRMLTEKDKRQYESEGGKGYPRVCEDCAEMP